MYFIVLKTSFNAIKSDMGVRFYGEGSGPAIAQLLYHYFLVAIRIGLVIVCINLASNEGMWILTESLHDMFYSNKWTMDDKMDQIKRPFSAILFHSANPWQALICWALWAPVALGCASLVLMLLVTVIYCCSFGLCLQGRSLGYFLTLLWTYVIETFIGTKNWRKYDAEDEVEELENDDFKGFKRSRNLRPKEIQALEALMGADDENNALRAQHSSGIFQAGRDCPICLGQIDSSAQVYQLKCNNSHIYHADCLTKLMELDDKLWKCTICKEPLGELVDTYDHEHHK